MSKKKTSVSLVRSSAAEYLTFVAASGQGGVEAIDADENVWLTQKMMGLLYDVDVMTINYHLKKIFSDHELQADSVIRNFRITATDGKTYGTQHYNLSAIISIGYKVNSEPLAIQWLGLGRNIEHRTLNMKRRSEEKKSFVEAVRRLNPAIPEEARATIRRNRIVQIERRLNP